MFKYCVLYLISINLISFITMYIDKQKAIKKKVRVSEKNLFFLSILGGSLGMLFGMYTFRHKTKHLQFTIGIPLIFTLQIILIFNLLMK